MQKIFITISLDLIAILCAAQKREEPKPNIIFILADDLSYSDLSCFGQNKFKTPNIDRIAQTPDHRDWGGGTHTQQNQMLVYFLMFKSGDFDMLPSQLNFYLRALWNAEIRTEFYWGHKGPFFSEQLEQFGLPLATSYGWNRPDTIRREWNTITGSNTIGTARWSSA